MKASRARTTPPPRSALRARPSSGTVFPALVVNLPPSVGFFLIRFLWIALPRGRSFPYLSDARFSLLAAVALASAFGKYAARHRVRTGESRSRRRTQPIVHT